MSPMNQELVLPSVHGQADNGYLRAAFADFTRLIDQARSTLADKNFDTLVGTGISGTVGASVLAAALNKHLLIVRRADDKSNHSGNAVEGRMGDRWVFVDDLIATGSTLKHVKRAIATVADLKGWDAEPEFVGAYTYGAYSSEAMWRHRA